LFFSPGGRQEASYWLAHEHNLAQRAKQSVIQKRQATELLEKGDNHVAFCKLLEESVRPNAILTWMAAMTKSERLMTLTCIAVLLFTAPTRADDDSTNALIHDLTKLLADGAVLQCGPATITVTPDKKLEMTGLPPGNYPINMKDDGLYIDGKLCKRCPAPAERRC